MLFCTLRCVHLQSSFDIASGEDHPSSEKLPRQLKFTDDLEHVSPVLTLPTVACRYEVRKCEKPLYTVLKQLSGAGK